MKRPIKVGKRPINEGKRPIKAKVLVGVSVGSLMGCFRAPPTWRKTAPLKRPIKRSMIIRRLSGPLRLRFQSRSRTPLRIAASIAFLFRACFKGFLTLSHHHRAVEPP